MLPILLYIEFFSHVNHILYFNTYIYSVPWLLYPDSDIHEKQQKATRNGTAFRFISGG